MPTTSPARTLHPDVLAAINALEAQGIRHKLTAPYQIMIGRLSYFPTRGTIVICGEEHSPIRNKGLEDAIDLAKERFPNHFAIRLLMAD